MREIVYPEFFRKGLPLLRSTHLLPDVEPCMPVHRRITGGPPQFENVGAPDSSASHLFSTLAQWSVLTPAPSTLAHLSHSKPPITPALPTLTNLVPPNPFPCNTCKKIITLSARRRDHLRPHTYSVRPAVVYTPNPQRHQMQIDSARAARQQVRPIEQL